MNEEHKLLPESQAAKSEITLRGVWDSRAISDLIRSKSAYGEMPACLFLGRKEALLLRSHLASAFGEEAVATLKSTYYMGLEVVEVDFDSFVSTGGRKTQRTLQDPIARRPAWRDRETDALWQLRIA